MRYFAMRFFAMCFFAVAMRFFGVQVLSTRHGDESSNNRRGHLQHAVQPYPNLYALNPATLWCLSCHRMRIRYSGKDCATQRGSKP